MTEITLTRTEKRGNHCILGELLIEDKGILLVTLELPMLLDESGLTKKNVSCIPEGSYLIDHHQSPRHGESLWIRDVPGRTEILIHKANIALDLRGCIAVGKIYGVLPRDGRHYPAVLKSRKAMRLLLDYTDPRSRITVRSDYRERADA